MYSPLIQYWSKSKHLSHLLSWDVSILSKHHLSKVSTLIIRLLQKKNDGLASRCLRKKLICFYFFDFNLILSVILEENIFQFLNVIHTNSIFWDFQKLIRFFLKKSLQNCMTTFQVTHILVTFYQKCTIHAGAGHSCASLSKHLSLVAINGDPQCFMQLAHQTLEWDSESTVF